MNLASFDIFDTVLLRKCGKPGNIFHLLAHRLYPDDEVKRVAFIQWRRQAEGRVASRIKGRETTIASIYTDADVAVFSDYTPAQLIEAEKEIEADNLTANPAVKSIIEKCRKEGKTICFISDMYLDSKFLAQILKREGCLAGNEKVYVSCEEGARKSTGALFDKVRNYINPTHWEHYGDHPVSDVKRAKEKGINATLIDTAFTESEKHLADNSKQHGYELSCLAGLQRVARITNGHNAYSTLAADFVSPAYIPYVQFVLEKAKELGIKRLYFLSRDSYILQKIAEQMQGGYPGIELKYLFVSRKALLLPYLQEPTAAKVLAVQDKQTLVGKYVKELLNSLGTSSAELKERFSTEFEYSRITNKQQEADFLNKIFGEKSYFCNHLKKIATEKREFLNAYFAQEGLFDNSEKAMVDVGWLGTTRLMINSILHEEKCKNTIFFYYGVRGDVLDGSHGVFYNYFTPQELSTELTTMVENYFSASPYPSTTGYRVENGKVIPTFKEDSAIKSNKIIESNIAASTYIAGEISHTATLKADMLRTWCKRTTETMLALKHHDIDLSPLCDAGFFDGKPFVKILSTKELLNIMLLGGRCTAFDKASVRLTTGRLFGLVWRICRVTGKIRRFLYLRFKAK